MDTLKREADLEQAVNTYGHSLLRYCQHILCDYHEAQDAVQTAFLKAWEGREKFQSGTNLSAWLYRLCYTTCMDILRRRKRLLPEPELARRETSQSDISPELRWALEQLSAQERALVFQRVMEGRSYRELAEVYRVPAATLRKRYERARDKLAQLLSEEGKTDEAK